ncbi:MAG: hypothetical protein RUDDFDWM_001532 [Candidatus Fervidibacterota bacterium]
MTVYIYSLLDKKFVQKDVLGQEKAITEAFLE